MAVIVYRIVVSIPLFQHEQLRSQAEIIANLSGAFVNLILIMALGRLYEKLAYKLTTWGKIFLLLFSKPEVSVINLLLVEMHRTQTEYEDNLAFKIFAFQYGYS